MGSLQCLARRESAVRGLAGPSSGGWCALRCLGLGRRARWIVTGGCMGCRGALSLLRVASDVGVLWMKPMDEGELGSVALNCSLRIRVGITSWVMASLAGIGRGALVKEKEKILKKRKS